jgi:hypothetical protein
VNVGRSAQTWPKRKRLPAILTGGSGKTIGFTSIAVPVMGFVLNDIMKPDSVVRALARGVIEKLIPTKAEKTGSVEITGDVEILSDPESGTVGIERHNGE